MSVRLKLTYTLKNPEEVLIDNAELFPQSQDKQDLPDIPEVRKVVARQYLSALVGGGHAVLSQENGDLVLVPSDRFVKILVEFPAISLASLDQVPPLPSGGPRLVR